MSNDYPTFFVAQLPATLDSGGYRDRSAALIARHGGTLRASQPHASVECLEPGTPAAALVIAEFDGAGGPRALWDDPEHRTLLAALDGGDEALFVGVAGLPYAGLPDLPEIPTTASVTPPAGDGPRAYMLIQGHGSDQSRMDEYRDVILPMLKELGAYYTVFDIEGNVDVLAGPWTEQIFAISRWPDHAAGHAFWDSDRYQNTAIPIRTGAGRFTVHFCEGSSG
ncbi:MAG: DUF1330 domain-containing protein [Pseudomonadota bacterium]